MRNHLNTSELFSSNPGELLHRGGGKAGYQSDSAINSSQSFTSSATNSQMMASQVENSQSSSFDLFSQMMSQQQGFSQQNENTSSNFYMKYMSKPPLFQKEHAPKKPTLTRKRSFQGVQELNRERAKEKDDRDLINTFIAIVRECADEVKHAASSIRKDVDSNIAETTKQSAAVIGKIVKELSDHHKQLLDSIKTRQDHEARSRELVEKIASKDAQIQLLESQLRTAREDRNEHLLKAMLDMYTEQQNVTRQHLDKVHDEQQGIREQQHKLLVEAEKNQTTLIKMTAPSQGAAAGNKECHYGHDSEGVHPSSVRPLPLGNAISQKRPMSVPVWSGAVQARTAPAPDSYIQSHQVPSQDQVNRFGIPYVNQLCPQTSSYSTAGQHGLLNDVASGEDASGIGVRSSASSSHLFQNQPAIVKPANQPMEMSCENYSIQQCTRQESTYKPQRPTHLGRPVNPVQEFHSMAPSASLSRVQQKTSCYDNFANKFSSPNYSSADKQLWSRKNHKPSPVAAIAPQVHKEPSDVETEESQPSQPTPRPRKQTDRRRKSKTHFGSKKKSRKGSSVLAQPQRKSARLSARNSPGVERDDDCNQSSRNRQMESFKKNHLEEAKNKNYVTQRAWSKHFPRSDREDVLEDSADESEESNSPREWNRSAVTKKTALPPSKNTSKKQLTEAKAMHSSLPSGHTKARQTLSNVAWQNDPCDEDDEYSFRDELVELPVKCFSEKCQKPGRSVSATGKNDADDVFTRRPVSTYTKPKQTRLTPLQRSVSQFDIRPNNDLRPRKEKPVKDALQEKKKPAGQKPRSDTFKEMDILDVIQTYSSDNDDSSQEILFNLKLPDSKYVKTEKNTKEANWSYASSPSANSRYPEQVVPEQVSDSSTENYYPRRNLSKIQLEPRGRERKMVSVRNNKVLTKSRKRRMIYGSQDNQSRTFAQYVSPVQQK